MIGTSDSWCTFDTFNFFSVRYIIIKVLTIWLLAFHSESSIHQYVLAVAVRYTIFVITFPTSLLYPCVDELANLGKVSMLYMDMGIAT